MPINGNASFVYYPGVPVGQRKSYPDTSGQVLKSANQPLVYQVAVEQNGKGLDYIPLYQYDVVNVLFDVYVSGTTDYYQAIDAGDPVATLRKSVDIPLDVYSNYMNVWIAGSGLQIDGNLNLRTWTVDIRSIIQSRLTYGLVPCGRGSFNQKVIQGHLGQGLSGKYGDRILSPLGEGGLRVAVKARFEVLGADGRSIEIAKDAGTSNDLTITSMDLFGGSKGPDIFCINAVRQMNQEQDLNEHTVQASTSAKNYEFLSMCPNGDITGNWLNPRYYKTIRTDEKTENLYFYLHSQIVSSGLTQFAGIHNVQTRTYKMYIKVETRNLAGVTTTKFLDTAYDFAHYSLGYWQQGIGPGQTLGGPQFPKAWLTQNVSPMYINSNSGSGTGGITSDVLFYRVALYWMDNEVGSCDGATASNGTDCDDSGGSWNGTEYRMTEYRYYKVDHSSENAPFPYLRVHWLNSLGGIDSYTFKRNKTESISRTLSTYERKPNDPQWTLETTDGTANTAMIDLTWNTFQASLDLQTGSDQYKSSTEILGVQSVKGGTVFSDTLERPTAVWLSELMKSPNVWIEEHNDRILDNSRINPLVYDNYVYYGELPGGATDYVPIIVDEGEMLIIDEEQRLVQMKLSYKYSNAEMTQSN